jgi:hypothetical protein
MMLSTIRPGDWNLPLLLHVGGAMLLVGALVVVAVAMAAALRRPDDAAALTRLAFRALLLGVIPADIVMRGAAEWVASEEGIGDATWVGIGYSVGDGGLVLAIIATVLAWRATRRAEAGASADAAGTAGPGGLGRATVALSALLLVAYAVAVWAMTTKPG